MRWPDLDMPAWSVGSDETKTAQAIMTHRRQ